MKEASMNQVHTYDKDSFHAIEKQNNEIAIKYEDFPTDYISPPGWNYREANNQNAWSDWFWADSNSEGNNVSANDDEDWMLDTVVEVTLEETKQDMFELQ